MKKKKLADYFIGNYSVSKTLRFELKPIGKTLQYIEKNGILTNDMELAEKYKLVKGIIDRYHKNFIESVLSEVELNGLENYYQYYIIPKRDETEEKQFSEVKADLRKQIVRSFTLNPMYKTLFSKDLIKKDLIYFTDDNKEEQSLIKDFGEFTTYFQGFYENRKNLYSDEEKSTAIAYRIIHQNLPKFIDNMRVYELVEDNIPEKQLDAYNYKLSQRFQNFNMRDYFELQGFNFVLSQTGIDCYNTILGAFAEDEISKVQGLNEIVNLHNQHLEKNGVKIPKFKVLFKQILSDRDKISFIPEKFEDDQTVLDAINEFYESLNETIFSNAEQINIDYLLENIAKYNLDGIYIKNDAAITTISQSLYQDWSYLKNAIGAAYDEKNAIRKHTEKSMEKKKKALKAVKSYRIAELNGMIMEDNPEYTVEQYFINQSVTIKEKINGAYHNAKYLFDVPYNPSKSLIKNDRDITAVKNLLDVIKELQLLIKPLLAGQEESNKDELFYTELLRISEELNAITPLYNKTRNYVTQKPYSVEKVKLNFFKSTLLDGWDKNKERDNLGILLQKDGLFYLGIINRQYSKIIDEAPAPVSNSIYNKMEYKLLPGPNKMLPKVFFSKSRIEEFAPSDQIVENYKKGTHKKGENFSLEDCHALIDFYKSAIKKHEDWSQFDFHFSDTDTYEDISGFYREVENQGYKLSFKAIDQGYINELVDSGKLYLFQIYNKDFSPYSKGKANLHTLYWKMLFDPGNLKNVVYKLNGKAEVFYRKASINKENMIIHSANCPLENKNPLNDKQQSEFRYDLIKDRRFTVDKFLFHVPITMNFQANNINSNRKLNQLIHSKKGTEDMHIIGIDRGERNLLYLVVIDMDGKIVEQMSLNKILAPDRNQNKDYHQLLDKREEDNLSARQNWQTINTIKEIKEGYLSQVIHIIAELMIKYNAIVVLEDLNFGFMRSRQKFEKQVYQKFEKMLIDKLNYLVSKDVPDSENGGLLRAYQLTEKFESFKRLGKQSGFLYYVPAWNTSKMDPTTGFVNLFYTKYESKEKTRDFICKFDCINYNAEERCFEFAFDYSKFTYKAEGSRLDWIVSSKGTRIHHYRNVSNNNNWDTEEVDLTKEFMNLFKTYNIISVNEDMRPLMLDVEKPQFYKQFMYLFGLMMQLRNSDEKKGIDQIVSPVKNADGNFYISGDKVIYPNDADANGAYNIARKGMWIVEQIQNTPEEQLDKIKLAISNKQWLQYAQEHLLV